MVGIAFEPAVDDVVTQRHGQHETDCHDEQILDVVHTDDVGDAGAVDSPHCHFAAAVLGVEEHKPEHSDERYRHGYGGKDDEQHRHVLLVLILAAELLVEMLHGNIFDVGVGSHFKYHVGHIFPDLAQVCPGSCAEIHPVCKLSPSVVAKDVERQRLRVEFHGTEFDVLTYSHYIHKGVDAPELAVGGHLKLALGCHV